MRLENQILDIYDDVNLHESLTKVASEFPEHLRSHPAPSMEARLQKPDHAFALCILTKHAQKLRKYPVDTPVDVFFSNLYLTKHAHKLPEDALRIVATNVKLACERFKLPPSDLVKAASVGASLGNVYIEPVATHATLSSPHELLMKQAAAEIPLGDKSFEESPYFYAIVKQGGDRRYAMPTPEFVKKAADYFSEHALAFSPEERQQFAHNVYRRGQELGVEIKDANIRKYAGLGGYSPDIDKHLSVRRALCTDADVAARYDRLLEKQASTDPKTFADTLRVLDKQAGLDRYYGGYLADAYTACLGMEKAASTPMIDLEDTTKRAIAESYLGKDVVDMLQKEGAAAIEALPNDAKEILAGIESGSLQ